MRNLARPMLRLLGRDDRGAIGVIIAILIGGGVLLGSAALVIDVGQIYQNRAELQNGADAAALAVARQCEQTQGPCAQGTALGTAFTYANANASALTQDSAGVDVVCGSGGLNTCTSAIYGSGLTSCPPDPTNGANFVDVLTETKLKSGSTLLPPIFARTIVGNSTYNGTTVKACAQAEWGPSGGLAFTVSTCEFDVATGGTGNPSPQPGTRYWNLANGYPNPNIPADVGYDTQFLIHDPHSDSTCPDGPANQDAPGAFGWAADPNGNCQVVINPDGTFGAETGNHAKGPCENVLAELWKNRTPVSVPVYKSVTGNGHNTTYTLAGFASIVITGFSSSGAGEPDWLNGPLLCGSPDTCIDGFLTSDTLSQTPENGPGATTPKLTG